VITAEEGEIASNILKQFENMPSAYVGAQLKDAVAGMGFAQETVDAFGEGYLAGELLAITSSALPGLKLLGKGATKLKEGVTNYAAGAEARIAERGRGVTLQSGFDPTGPVDEAIVGAQKLLGKGQDEAFYVGVRQDDEIKATAQTEVQSIAQTKGNKRPKVDDVADYFNSQHEAVYGRKLNPDDDADFSLAVTDAAKEIKYQLDQGTSGKGWYDNDVRQTFENLSRIPGLERLADDESLRVLWTALAAPTSIGQKVDPGNTKAATAALLGYLRTGQVPTNPPAPGAVTEGIKGAGWGAKQQSVAAGMKVIKYLVDTKGVDGFADWWLSPHTLKELTDIRKAAGLSGGPSGVGGGKDSLHLGSMILGDKTGKYSLNLNGYQATTKDSWFSRSYNRHFGSMKNPDGSLAEAPRNLQERARMEQFVSKVIDELDGGDLSEQDTQAVIRSSRKR